MCVQVFVGVFEQLFYESLVGDWAWEPVDDVLPVRRPHTYTHAHWFNILDHCPSIVPQP
jgi:hypothetical protein